MRGVKCLLFLDKDEFPLLATQYFDKQWIEFDKGLLNYTTGINIIKIFHCKNAIHYMFDIDLSRTDSIGADIFLFDDIPSIIPVNNELYTCMIKLKKTWGSAMFHNEVIDFLKTKIGIKNLPMKLKQLIVENF
jgi:hypothetical protein